MGLEVRNDPKRFEKGKPSSFHAKKALDWGYVCGNKKPV